MQPSVLVLFALGALLSGGAAAPEGRIVGGDDAVPGQIPYQAALKIAGVPTCGAIILSERYLLTALKCVCSSGSDKPWPPQMFSVLVGSVDLYTGGQRIVVEEITVNPNYSDLDTGVALLKLTEQLVFSDTVQPIAMSKESPPIGAEIEVSGWGLLTDKELNMYHTLQINGGYVVEAEVCYRALDKIDDQVLCLQLPRKNGICRGDFGGPAVYQGKLVGMAANVVGECGSLLPDVFTSIAVNYDWLEEHMTA